MPNEIIDPAGLATAGALSVTTGNPLPLTLFLTATGLQFVGGLFDDTAEQQLKMQKQQLKNQTELARVQTASGRLGILDSIKQNQRLQNIRNVGGGY